MAQIAMGNKAVATRTKTSLGDKRRQNPVAIRNGIPHAGIRNAEKL
jgi:hypothetical protein